MCGWLFYNACYPCAPSQFHGKAVISQLLKWCFSEIPDSLHLNCDVLFVGLTYYCVQLQTLFQFNEFSIYISDTTYDSTLQFMQHVLSLLILHIWYGEPILMQHIQKLVNFIFSLKFLVCSSGGIDMYVALQPHF